MNARAETWLWLIQRATAAALILTVTIHLATIIYAIHGDLSASEILSRIRGSIAWLVVYGTFVTAVALHAPIGLRTFLREWSPLYPEIINGIAVIFGVLLMGLGWRAVLALYA